ncbi:MAG TPA: selenide, water dikinase SelD [Acidimicrobiales bacterium]|nr:selenide, water dikinase SelD [Acidimicrobiales bacterium]
MRPRLTSYSPGAGCACKLGPAELGEVMGRLVPGTHPDLLWGSDTGDDAALWRIGEGRALVLTADFLTPVVDDARAWGRIAATNAASDVYAMGGRPLVALNLVAWNRDELGADLLVEVLQGALDAAASGGWMVAGGHSITDPHPSFGQAVVGEVDPDRALLNRGLRAGEALVLTKAVGVGLITSAIKDGSAPAGVVEAAVASMCTLNDRAAEAALAAGSRAATDVTGFGLLGHLRRLTEASGVGAVLDAGAVPALPGAAELAERGPVPGGARRNREWVEAILDAGGVGEVDLTLLCDPQTSGGLLFGADPAAAAEAVAALREAGLPAAVVGSVVEGHRLVVRA